MFEGNPLSIYNLYSPSSKMVRHHTVQPEGERWIIIRDFNSHGHSPSWGYPDLDSKGDEVEDWITTNRPEEPHTYYSRAWQTTGCPDIAISTDDVAKITERHVEQQFGGSGHKPDSYKLWKLTNLLKRRQSRNSTDGPTVRGIVNYSKGSSQLPGKALPRREQCQGNNQSSQRAASSVAEVAHIKCMSQPIAVKETEVAIKQLKRKEAPEPDGVTNDMIKHLDLLPKYAP